MKQINFITEYLPTRYTANAKQREDRNMCYNFKDGILTSHVKDAFISKARMMTGGTYGWVVCFIPASTSAKTRRRYNKLADAFRSAGYEVELDALYNKYDKESEHECGKSSNPIASFGFNSSRFHGKKVLLIDDIITRGTTFNMAADTMLDMGATVVEGLFLAKTINPDYHPRQYWSDSEDYIDIEPDPDPEDFIGGEPEFYPEDMCEYVPDPEEFAYDMY